MTKDCKKKNCRPDYHWYLVFTTIVNCRITTLHGALKLINALLDCIFRYKMKDQLKTHVRHSPVLQLLEAFDNAIQNNVNNTCMTEQIILLQAEYKITSNMKKKKPTTTTFTLQKQERNHTNETKIHFAVDNKNETTYYFLKPYDCLPSYCTSYIVQYQSKSEINHPQAPKIKLILSHSFTIFVIALNKGNELAAIKLCCFEVNYVPVPTAICDITFNAGFIR